MAWNAELLSRAGTVFLRSAIPVSVLVILLGIARAEKLPVKSYTIADGLAMDQVNAIRQDSRGFLWFATTDGVSWFDGYEFTTYRPDDGLPRKEVMDVLETRAGDLWLATFDGVCLFRRALASSDPEGRQSRFQVFRPWVSPGSGSDFLVNRIVEAPDGSIWCGALQGLFRLAQERGTWKLEAVDARLKYRKWADTMIRDLFCEPSGTLWIAANGGFYRRGADGRSTRMGTELGLPDREFLTVCSSPSGRVWVGTGKGLFCLPSSPGPLQQSQLRRYDEKDGLPSARILSARFARDGTLWVGTSGGLAHLTFAPDRDEPSIQAFTSVNGLTDQQITSLEEDQEGNLWAGTDHGGAVKISRRGFQTFDLSDGLTGARVDAAFEDRAGNIGFLVQVPGRIDQKYFSLYDGKRFSNVRLAGPKSFGWVGYQGVLQDHEGDWWVATGREGLWRFTRTDSFAALTNQRPSRTYGPADGLASATVFSVFEDSRGDIWVGMQDGSQLARWERKTGRISTFDIGSMAESIAEDRAGNIWVGMFSRGIWRYRNGRGTLFTPADGVPRGGVVHLHVDRRGRLWASSLTGGAICVPEPEAERPRFTTLTTREGLSSNHVRFVLEDREGGYFIGTLRGLDYWDPQKGTIRQYTTNDGLAGNLQSVGLLDRTGNCWFGTFLGVSRLITSKSRESHPVDVWIRGLRLGGMPWPIDVLGQRTVGGVVVPFERNSVAVDFAGVTFSPGDVLNYRYRLSGDSEWRSLSSQRSLDLVDVRPGSYRLELQAVNSDGVMSLRPAVIEFTVLVPIWRRWWLLTSAFLLLGAGVFAIVRLQVLRRLEMERVRTRIATDLHDDIGASLSQISVLSEVAVRRLPEDPESAVQSLKQVTETSATLLDSMTDIVWAINPARDSFDDLVHRMRRFANDLFADGTIRCRFVAPEIAGKFALGNDCRRQIYLIYKECLHNLVRHSKATQATIELRIVNGWIELEIGDNGVGFDSTAARQDGHGLRSIRSRAGQLHASLSIESSPGQGTFIRFRMPVSACRWRVGIFRGRTTC